MKLFKHLGAVAIAATALGISIPAGADAQTVTLRVHQFLPAQAPVPRNFIAPWAKKIEEQSKGQIKVELYPSMQLGGTPPQLFDQARDGVADIIWTIPTYQAGRFTKSEVFELPFMTLSAETGSPALWDYIQKNSLDEFRGVRLLAAHVHDGSLLHFASRRVTTMD